MQHVFMRIFWFSRVGSVYVAQTGHAQAACMAQTGYVQAGGMQAGHLVKQFSGH